MIIIITTMIPHTIIITIISTAIINITIIIVIVAITIIINITIIVVIIAIIIITI